MYVASICAYTQSLHAINGLIAVGRLGKLTLWTILVFMESFALRDNSFAERGGVKFKNAMGNYNL